MKILVTGANGYLGSGIVKQLVKDGNDVIATDLSCEHIDSKVQYIKCNLFEEEDPYNTLGRPDVVLHLAWRDGFVHNSDKHMEDLPAHYHFLKKMAQAGVKRLAVMGSMHEIGFFEGAINENTPCKPMNLYGIAKDTLRNATKLLATQNDLQFQWLRGFYIVGNTPVGNSIFSKIVSAEERNEKSFPFTSGQNQYDFLDYEEFCQQVAATVVQDEVLEIINICSGKPEKLADRVERFIKENNFSIRLDYGKFPDRPYDSKAVWGNNIKIQKILEKM